MNKLILLIIILQIVNIFASTAPGFLVSCINTNDGSCISCEPDPSVERLFFGDSATNCYVQDCSARPHLLNAYVCKSCFGIVGSFQISGQFYDPAINDCVAQCPNDSIVYQQTCLRINKTGANVICASNTYDCTGCGSSISIQALFTYVQSTICRYTDCSIAPSSYSGYICKSCFQEVGAHTAFSIGAYYYPSTNSCISQCPIGTYPDQSYTCQQVVNYGDLVSCGTAGTPQGTCTRCGSTQAIQNLFQWDSNSNCKIINCSIVPHFYNGNVCKSCYKAANAASAFKIGPYFNPITNSCVASCPSFTFSDNDNICQNYPTNPVLGKNVACGTESIKGGETASCNKCGDIQTTQSLFTYDLKTLGVNCFYADCRTTQSTLNGWICNSCDGVPGSNIPPGIYFNGTTCTYTCNKGVANSKSGYICQNSINLSEHKLNFVQFLLFLCLLF
ncbi:immobilization antigen (macronuclear) [Tetrahymena thermophila SB210]|uniref:Immobilization antigen n=1 Tax=Tetrahymena thermophila (strain SB210) TaxID=312017 RepID=I7M681_TETTS|nr:immobilization antigen [Tetrahymena thermophila SB210]EAR84619.1 immobilization antigen [Tetrahymena thermophila SB210]|eukprot:XP_001032282.1 immobilization antigen [Tetrahymena thermophila SB210]